MKKPRLAFSIGDLNGISLELIVKAHEEIASFCSPFYFLHFSLLKEGLKLLKSDFSVFSELNIVEFYESEEKKGLEFIKREKNINIYAFAIKACDFSQNFRLKPGLVDAKMGAYSFASFKAASFACKEGFFKALITLPINKKAWNKAGLKYLGHTGALSDFFQKRAIMMLGCEHLFVALFSEHIAIKKVANTIKLASLGLFLCDFASLTTFQNIGVLGLNPHAGDDGAIGEEELIIEEAIFLANLSLGLNMPFKKLLKQRNIIKKSFQTKIKNKKALKSFDLGFDEEKKEFEKRRESLLKSLNATNLPMNIYYTKPLVPDSAFSKQNLAKFRVLVGMYHDQVLAALKALYFEESINISLNLPIIRTSVDHGTAFDKAYKNSHLSTKSLINAAKAAIRFKEKTR